MKRKRLLAGALALAMTVGMAVTPAGAVFTDTAGHWASGAIDKWSQEYGIIQGYEDGTFRPDNSITRGAFAGILDRFMKYQAISSAATFIVGFSSNAISRALSSVNVSVFCVVCSV